MEYGQGMVRPACWARRGSSYVDRQDRIATGIFSFHYDISSYWNDREVTPEAMRDLQSLFVATSPDLSAVWWTPSAWPGTNVRIAPVWCPVLEGGWEWTDGR